MGLCFQQNPYELPVLNNNSILFDVMYATKLKLRRLTFSAYGVI
jgi:hypothetical protein